MQMYWLDVRATLSIFPSAIDKLSSLRDFLFFFHVESATLRVFKHGLLFPGMGSGRRKSKGRKVDVINIFFFLLLSFSFASTSAQLPRCSYFLLLVRVYDSRRASNEKPILRSVPLRLRINGGGGCIEGTPAERVFNQILSPRCRHYRKNNKPVIWVVGRFSQQKSQRNVTFLRFLHLVFHFWFAIIYANNSIEPKVKCSRLK